MKAVAIFPNEKQVRVVDHPAPKISAPTEVRLRMLNVGVCGTDRELASFKYGTPPRGSEYMVIGHESLAEVVDGGAESKLKQGDLVIATVRRPCDRADCRACNSGRQDFCFTGAFTERGIKEAHGFLTEYIVEDEKYLRCLPRELREVGVLIEPLTIAEKALIQIWQMQSRLPWGCPIEPGKAVGHCHRAVVLGAGPVGLLGAMALTAHGFDTWVYSRSKKPNSKADVAESFGAKYISAEEVSVEQLAELVGNIDVVYEAAGAPGVAFDVMRVLGANGIFVLTGIPDRKTVAEIDLSRILFNLVLRNQVIFGTVNAGDDAFDAAVRDLGEFMRRWPSSVRALITGRYGLDDAPEQLTGRARGIKEVVVIDKDRVGL